MSKPILLVVDDESDVRQALAETLEKRYGADYDVVSKRLPKDAKSELEQLKKQDRDIALVVADYHMPGMNGIEFLRDEVQNMYPEAKRVLLIDWLDTSPNSAIAQAMTLGQLDYYIFKPWGLPEERLYPAVGELLSEWVRTKHGSGLEVVRVIGDSRSRAMYTLKDFLHRNNIPFKPYSPKSKQGRHLLDEARVSGSRFPIVIRFDGKVFPNPSKLELANALAMKTQADAGLYDVVIVGAGPAGLTAAVYGASEGLRVAAFEAEALGGQAGTTSLIRNYLGFPRGLTGSDLARRATEQAWLFGATAVIGHKAVGLEIDGRTRMVTLSDGSKVKSRTVVISTGVAYNLLEAKGIEPLVGAGVFYGAAVTEAQAMGGKKVFVVGGGNSAGQAATHLADYASKVTMIVRGGSLSTKMSEFLVREIKDRDNIVVKRNTKVVQAHGEQYLERLTLQESDGSEVTVPAQGLFILTGGRPHTEWLDGTLEREDGLILTGPDLLPEGKPPEGWPLERDPYPLETSVPGVFAAGDVRYGAAQRIAAAVGDGSIVIRLVHRYLREHYEKSSSSSS